MYMSGAEYAAWKKRCALEKVAREAKRRRMMECTETRKRTYPFEEAEEAAVHKDAGEVAAPSTPSTGAYVTLPTLPPVRMPVEKQTEKVQGKLASQISESTSVTPTANALTDCLPKQRSTPLEAPLLPPSPYSPILLHSGSSILSVLSAPPPPTPTPAPPLPITPTPIIQPNICAALQAMPTSLLLNRLEKGVPLFHLGEPTSPVAHLSENGSSTIEKLSSESIDHSEIINMHSPESSELPINLITTKSLKHFPWNLCGSPYFPFHIPLSTEKLELSLEIQQLLTQCNVQGMTQ